MKEAIVLGLAPGTILHVKKLRIPRRAADV